MGRHSLELRLAERLGISTAAVYDRLYDLCQAQEKRHSNRHDGHYWVRLPHKDFHRVFPFLSEGTVSKALRKLRDEGLVIVAHYDKTCLHDGGNPLTNWYSII